MSFPTAFVEGYLLLKHPKCASWKHLLGPQLCTTGEQICRVFFTDWDEQLIYDHSIPTIGFSMGFFNGLEDPKYPSTLDTTNSSWYWEGYIDLLRQPSRRWLCHLDPVNLKGDPTTTSWIGCTSWQATRWHQMKHWNNVPHFEDIIFLLGGIMLRILRIMGCCTKDVYRLTQAHHKNLWKPAAPRMILFIHKIWQPRVHYSSWCCLFPWFTIYRLLLYDICMDLRWLSLDTRKQVTFCFCFVSVPFKL